MIWHGSGMNFCIYQTNGLVVFMIYRMKKGAFFTLVLLSNSNKKKYSAGTVNCSAH